MRGGDADDSCYDCDTSQAPLLPVHANLVNYSEQDVFVIPDGAPGALAELERRKFTAEEGVCHSSYSINTVLTQVQDHLTLLNGTHLDYVNFTYIDSRYSLQRIHPLRQIILMVQIPRTLLPGNVTGDLNTSAAEEIHAALQPPIRKLPRRREAAQAVSGEWLLEERSEVGCRWHL